MSAELLLLVESRKKSGMIAALLNLFFPGAGYFYCGNWILGIVGLAFAVFVTVVTMGVAYPAVALGLMIDGALCARRYNKKLVTRMLKEHAAIQKVSVA